MQAAAEIVGGDPFPFISGYHRLSGPAARRCGARPGQLVPSRCSYVCCLALLSVLLLLSTGCTSVPHSEEFQATRAVVPATGGMTDGRARFREIFCGLAQQRGIPADRRGATCNALLWRLADEPSQQTETPLPALDPALRVFVVGGAFSDCFGPSSIAYRRAVERLSAQGVPIGYLPISSRSSSEHNAGMMAEALAGTPDGPVLLVGYSKGAVDILYLLANYPDLARRVVAVVSAAGPIFGSAVAERGIWAYETFFSSAFAGRCDPGDGGVLESLLPQTRQAWLQRHPLPGDVRFYSLLAFTTYDHLARTLRPTWQILSSIDPRNDGQLTIGEGTWPGSTLLGYANADHWGVAIDIEEELSFLAARPDATHYPRDVLFEAVLRYVSEDLQASLNPLIDSNPPLSQVEGQVRPVPQP